MTKSWRALLVSGCLLIAPLVGVPAQASVTPTGEGDYRPDAWIKVRGDSWSGKDVYGGFIRQRVRAKMRNVGSTRVVLLRLQNDGALPDRLSYEVNGALRGYRVKVSPKRNGRTERLNPGEKAKLRLRVTRGPRAERESRLLLTIRVHSAGDPSLREAVTARFAVPYR